MCDDEYEGKKTVIYFLYKSKLKNRIREEIIGWVVAWKHWNTFRRSQQDLFCKKDIFKNFTKFIEKDVCQSLLNKVRSLSLQIYLKMAKIFSCEFCEILKNTFFYRTPLGRCHLLTTPLEDCSCHWLSLVDIPYCINHLSANPTKWSNTLKSVFDHFVDLAFQKGYLSCLKTVGVKFCT